MRDVALLVDGRPWKYTGRGHDRDYYSLPECRQDHQLYADGKTAKYRNRINSQEMGSWTGKIELVVRYSRPELRQWVDRLEELHAGVLEVDQAVQSPALREIFEHGQVEVAVLRRHATFAVEIAVPMLMVEISPL